MDTRITTQRGVPLVEQFYDPLDSNWDVTKASGIFAASGGDLLVTVPTAGASGSIVTKLGYITNGRFSFDDVGEAARAAHCGYVLSLKSASAEIAIGLNASPSTKLPSASAEAGIVRFNSSLNGTWGQEQVLAVPGVLGKVSYTLVIYEERVTLCVNGLEALSCQSPAPRPYDTLYPTILAVSTAQATELPTLTIGQVEAFSYSGVHVEGGNSRPLKVEVSNSNEFLAATWNVSDKSLAVPISYSELIRIWKNNETVLSGAQDGDSWNLVIHYGGLARCCSLKYSADPGSDYQDFTLNYAEKINQGYRGFPYDGWKSARIVSHLDVSSNSQGSFDLRPTAVCENHLPAKSYPVATLTSASGDMVVQTFRVGISKLSKLFVDLLGTPASSLIDDMQSYPSTTELRAAWVASDSVNTPISLHVEAGGNKKIHLDAKVDKSAGDRITRTHATVQDRSLFASLEFDFEQDTPVTEAKMRYRMVDADNYSAYCDIVVKEGNDWKKTSLPWTSFVMEGSSAPDLARIKKDEFEVLFANQVTRFHIDNIRWLEDPGTLDVQIYDLGSGSGQPTSLPPSPLLFDNGLNYARIKSLPVMEGLVGVDLKMGVTADDAVSAELTPGNLYALVFKKLSNVNTSVTFYGSPSGNPYKSGSVLTSQNNGSTLTAALSGQADISFSLIGVPPEAIWDGVGIQANNDPKSSLITVFLHRGDEPSIGQLVLYEGQSLVSSSAIDMREFKAPVLVPSSDHIELFWRPDTGTTTTKILLQSDIRYRPFTIYG